MTAGRTITLSRAAFHTIRRGRSTVRVADSEGQRVALFSQQVWPSTRVPALQPSVVLSRADLDLIDQQPEGLVCAATAGGAGWTIRLLTDSPSWDEHHHP
jgi:hypothetical protein